MNTFTTGQARDYAARLGLLAGALWVASFYCSIYGLGDALLGNVGIWLGLISPFIVGMNLQTLRRRGIEVPYRRLWYMAWLTFLYATLLTTAAQFIYFRYLDGGHLVNAYSELLQQPEFQQLLGQMLPGEDPAKVTKEFMDAISAISPLDITLTFSIYNLFLSTVLAPFAALIGKFGRKGETQNPS